MSEEAPNDGQISKRWLPEVTTSSSEQYIERAASVISYAMLPNVLWRLFFSAAKQDNEQDTLSADERTLQTYHSIVKQYLLPGVKSGVFVVEAGDFAACAAWWPPGSHQPPHLEDCEASDDLNSQQEDTLMAVFERQVEKVKAESIWAKYGQEFWALGIVARDPRRKPALPGAVRAVLQPAIDRARAEGKPIWLVTTDSHARDVYLHLGWQLVKTIEVGQYANWCMILYPPSTE